MKSLTILLITLTIKTYIVEMETYPSKKTCISELFRGGEPLSINLTTTSKLNDRYSLYITIETSARVLLGHKKHDFEENNTNMAFNNDKDQDLFICVDNFENYNILVKLEIKVNHLLGITDTAPATFEYNKLNLKLNDVKEKIDSGYNYFVQNEAFTNKMVQAGQSFEVFMVFVSFITIGCFVFAGLLQVFFIRRDIVMKKSW